MMARNFIFVFGETMYERGIIASQETVSKLSQTCFSANEEVGRILMVIDSPSMGEDSYREFCKIAEQVEDLCEVPEAIIMGEKVGAEVISAACKAGSVIAPHDIQAKIEVSEGHPASIDPMVHHLIEMQKAQSKISDFTPIRKAIEAVDPTSSITGIKTNSDCNGIVEFIKEYTEGAGKTDICNTKGSASLIDELCFSAENERNKNSHSSAFMSRRMESILNLS